MKTINGLIPISEGKKALAFLKNANLETVKFDEIKRHTDILVKCGFMAGEFTPNSHWIFRGVVVDVEEIPNIKKVGRISYRPRKKNDPSLLKRASSNKYQIFYGSIPTPDFGDAGIASILEIDNIREENFPEDQYEYVVIGMWFIKKTFLAASVGMHSTIAENSNWAKNIVIQDKGIYEHIDDTGFISEVMQFIGSEFSKNVPKEKEYLYKISAAYGDSLFDLGIDSILFPSVKTAARSFNVAIMSNVVDNQFIDIETSAITRGNKIEKEVFWGWYLQCPKVYGDDLKWSEPPGFSQISQNDLSYFRKIIEANGKFMNPA